jgi:hypothetical protein
MRAALTHAALGVAAFAAGALVGVLFVIVQAALKFRAIPLDGPDPWVAKRRWN